MSCRKKVKEYVVTNAGPIVGWKYTQSEKKEEWEGVERCKWSLMFGQVQREITQGLAEECGEM